LLNEVIVRKKVNIYSRGEKRVRPCKIRCGWTAAVRWRRSNLSDEITAATGKHTSQKRQITNKVSLTVSTRVNEEKIRLLLKPTVKKTPVLSRLSSKVIEDITVSNCCQICQDAFDSP